MKAISSMNPVVSDETLIARIRTGDDNSLGILVARYEKLVAYLARSFAAGGVEQEDLIQEGMLGLARALNGYSPSKDASFNTYASTCIKNALISAVRRSLSGDKRLNVLYIEDVGEVAGGFEVEQILSGAEYQGSYLDDIVNLLSEFETGVLRLYMSGMTRKEISLKIQKSYKSIDNALVRIKSKARSSRSRR